MDRDPRVYFAAERTLLAWVRTGVTVIGLGFVVARFGLFLRLVATSHAEVSKDLSFPALLGAALVLAGGAFTGVAALEFRQFLRELAPEERPRRRVSASLALVVASLVSAGGVLLGVFLIRTP